MSRNILIIFLTSYECCGLIKVKKTMENTLYEFYDKYNNLLYIGITDCFYRRLRQHYKTKTWYSMIANIRLFYFNSRDELEKEEKQRIINNKPLFNIIYNNDNVEQAIIEYCTTILNQHFIFENKKCLQYINYQYEEVDSHIFNYSLFQILSFIITDISFTSPQFKRIAGEVINNIET